MRGIHFEVMQSRFCAALLVFVAGANVAQAGYIDELMATPDLVATWRLGEASGPTAVEEVGTNANANNGTYVGMIPSDFGQPGLLTGDSNTAVNFNGSTAYVNAGNDASLNGAWGGLTVAAWINADSHPGAALIAGKWAGSVANDHFGFFTVGGKLVAAVNNGASGISGATGTATLTTGERHFVAMTWQSGTGAHQLYIDGAIDPISAPTNIPVSTINTSSTKDFFIGAQSPGFRPFDGIIDEVSVFSRALSLSEIAALYQIGFDGPPPPAPEPGSMILLAGGLCLMAARRRRNRAA